VAAFEGFCKGPAREASAVYVLGDLFDQWIGDDQLREPVAAAVASALRGVSDSGVPVGIIVGNRDFLLGPRFTEATGAKLLPERSVIDVAGTPTVVSHGDEMCTSDVAYQRFRSIARARVAWFLALPYFARRAVGNWLRSRSRAATALKQESILDVEPSAVEAAFRSANVARMIHGHTHRPAQHRHVVDGRECERYVLADWYDRGSYLEVDAEGVRTRQV
jgi:UDP-2,3-diacylglucosamine hydrolase